MEPKNPLLYNVNYEGVEINLTPPNHRTPKWLAWLKVLLYPLQWLHNNFFQDYANGSSYNFYDASKTYNSGDRVIDTDNAVYECELNGVGGSAWSSVTTYAAGNYAAYNNQLWQSLTNNNINNQPGADTINWQSTAPHLNTAIWWQVNTDYRGARPRSIFNGQKLVLEGVLNQYFRTNFRQPPYMQITGVELTNGGSGYSKPVVTVTGANGTGIDAVVKATPNTSSPYNIVKLELENPGFNYLNIAKNPSGGYSLPALTITDNVIVSPGSGATGRVFISGSHYPDIFINNNIFPNSVFTVGYIEAQSSVAVYSNGVSVDFVEFESSDYNFNATDFTIFVPQSFYENLAASNVGSISVTNQGSDYDMFSVLSVSITGGGGAGATANAFVLHFPWPSYTINVIVTNPGYGYTSAPTVTINKLFGRGSGAMASANLEYLVSENIIRTIADKYVIAGMTYDVKTY